MHYTHREVRYHEDVASLFAHIGGLDAQDSVLLESADITTRSGLQSVAVLRASVRVTCTGNRVTVQPLTPSGEVITAGLDLDEFRVGEGVYEFPASRAADERERLTAPSAADVLRALTTRAGFDIVVYRNTVSADTVLAAEPELIVLSPGPGYPADAGCMMEVIERAQGRIPILGICLGYQALIEHFGGCVQPCGPEHGTSVPMRLTASHQHFRGSTVGGTPGQTGLDVPVARYHSLGATEAPAGITPLAWTDTQIGSVIMAAKTNDGYSIGFQFHPESILTPAGPQLLERCVEHLLQKGRDNG